MQKQKVLIHSNYEPGNRGGIEFVVQQLKTCLEETYHISLFYGGSKNSYLSGTVNYIERKVLLKIKGACLLSFGNFYFFKQAMKNDTIIFQEPYPTLWPALFLLKWFFKSKKIVFLVHADPVAASIIRKTYRVFRTALFRGATVVATSPQLLKTVRSAAAVSQDSYVIPLAVPDLSLNDCLGLTDKTFLENLEEKYFLYYGRLAEYKGLLNFCEAARLLPQCKFVIAGVGPLRDDIHAYINFHHLTNMIFIDRFISEAEKYCLLERCLAFVLPSINKNEAFGLVQLEAMSCSKPILNTELENGVNFVAPHKIAALTTSPGDSEGLANLILQLHNNPQLAHDLGKSGRLRYLSTFSRDAFNNSWLRLLDKIHK